MKVFLFVFLAAALISGCASSDSKNQIVRATASVGDGEIDMDGLKVMVDPRESEQVKRTASMQSGFCLEAVGFNKVTGVLITELWQCSSDFRTYGSLAACMRSCK